MKRFLDVLKAVCSIAAAIIVYITVIKITEGDANILLYAVASVLAVSLAASLFVSSRLAAKAATVERILMSMADDSPYTEEDDETPEEETFRIPENTEYFATEDPDYKGTDFSGEEYFSANTDDTGDTKETD